MKNLFLIALILFTLSGTKAQAHCEIPCGIFDDGARFDLFMEHAVTIEKSMNKINELSLEEKPDYHTISRWTANKEQHASEVMHKAAQYFLAQRIKLPKADASREQLNDYATSLRLLHEITVKAMKTKHSTDLKAVEALREKVTAFKQHYYKDHDKKHDHKH